MDIVERLRESADYLGCNYVEVCDDMREAAAEIQRLRERIYNLTLLVDAREDWEA